MKPINIVYLHSHDTGRYIQPHGHAIPTPNLQRLAEEGVLFRQAFCANPTCSPSRAALLTGQWAHRCGMFGLVNRGWSLHHPERLLNHRLQEAGYETVLAGVHHVVKNLEESGWNRMLELKPTQPWGQTIHEAAAAFLDESHDRPFFLDVGFLETHRIGDAFSPLPDGWEPTDPRYVRPPAPFPDTPQLRQDMANYIDSARLLDERMGDVLEAIDRNGLRDNTLVICTTDHGTAFPRMKCNLTDQGIGVLLILRAPGGCSGGKVVDGMVSHIDLFPTICELIGIPVPAYAQGLSVLPLIRREVSHLREEVFAEVNYHGSYDPQRAVRTQRWKYIRRFDERRTPVLTNCDDSITKTYLVEHGWKTANLSRERLYDLLFDPCETNNLAEDDQYAGMLDEMRTR